MDAPTYPFKPIYSLRALALALGEDERLLERVAARADRMYRHVPQEKKGTKGEIRHTYDAHEPLKRVQRKVVDRILAKAKFPLYLHGGIRDVSSPRSILSNAMVHAGARYVVLQDIENFFPSISTHQVFRIYRDLFGFGEPVSMLLASISTREGSTPQGASTSGYLANLLFWDVEPKVVNELFIRDFRYSRFADDITISSERKPTPQELADIISTITGMLASKGCRQKRKKLHVRVRGQGVKVAEGDYEALTVTGLSVFNSTPGLTKLERKRIRSAVRELEILASSTPSWSTIEPRYHQVMGRVGRLLACGHPDGEALKIRLNSVKRLCQVPLLERYRLGLSDDKDVLELACSSASGVAPSLGVNEPLPWE